MLHYRLHYDFRLYFDRSYVSVLVASYLHYSLSDGLILSFVVVLELLSRFSLSPVSLCRFTMLVRAVREKRLMAVKYSP